MKEDTMAAWTIREDFLDSNRRVGAGSARPGARTRASASVLASVLLGFAALLAAPQTAHAVDKEILSDTLTAAATSSTPTIFGFEVGNYGSLASGLGNVSVEELGAGRFFNRVTNDNTSPGTLKLNLTATDSDPDPLDNGAFRARLTVHLDMTSFAGSSATVADTGNILLTWNSTGLTWADAQEIAVRMTLRVPGIDSIAFNSAGPDNTFDTGDAVTATVTFNEAVTVDTTGGTPQLTINMGGTDQVLDYNSGTGTTALVFSGYTVAFGDTDTDGLSIEANKLDLNGGTIKATADANLDAVLDHTAVAASASHTVSGVTAPMVPFAPFDVSVTAHATTTPGSIQLGRRFDFGSPARTSVEFRASTDSGVNWNHAVTDDWPDTTRDSRNKELLAGLTPGTAYTFEIRGRNADGPGPATQATGTTAAAVSITGVALTSNPETGTTYDTGEDVEATLTFSRPVTFAKVGGNLPQLELDFAGTGQAGHVRRHEPADRRGVHLHGGVRVTRLRPAWPSPRTSSRSTAARSGWAPAPRQHPDYIVPLAHTALAADTDHKVSATTVPSGPTVDSIAFKSAGSDGTFMTSATP